MGLAVLAWHHHRPGTPEKMENGFVNIVISTKRLVKRFGRLTGPEQFGLPITEP
jgi:hypothetical protein